MPSLELLVFEDWTDALAASEHVPAGHEFEVDRYGPVEQTERDRTIAYPAPSPDGQFDRVERPDHEIALEHTLTVRTETLLDPGDTPVLEALDPHYLWIVKASRADPTRDGLAYDTRYQGRVFSKDDQGRPTGRMITQWEIVLYVNEDNPEVAG